jgi:predicted nuclease with TOPRIM domain
VALDPAWIALIATVTGGVGLKVTEHWLGRNKVKVDEAAQIRDELRLEIAALREENKQLGAAIDKWREEYYALRDKYYAELTAAVGKIREEVLAELNAKALQQLPPEPDLTPKPGA